jgi:putative FmdB family regulatory protein
MPIYEYQCGNCGEDFTRLRPMAEYNAASDCPACGGTGERLITAPQLNLMKAHVRFAHQTNERSAHQPRQSRHVCSAGCSHGKEAKPVLVSGSQGKRPWMLGH